MNPGPLIKVFCLFLFWFLCQIDWIEKTLWKKDEKHLVVLYLRAQKFQTDPSIVSNLSKNKHNIYSRKNIFILGKEERSKNAF